MGLLVNEILDELKKMKQGPLEQKNKQTVFCILLKVSAAVNTFHKVKEEKSRFPAEVWLENEQKNSYNFL